MTVLVFAGKLLFLVFSIAFTFTNVGKLCYGQSISQAQTYLMAVSITGFVALQWLI